MKYSDCIVTTSDGLALMTVETDGTRIVGTYVSIGGFHGDVTPDMTQMKEIRQQIGDEFTFPDRDIALARANGG